MYTINKPIIKNWNVLVNIRTDTVSISFDYISVYGQPLIPSGTYTVPDPIGEYFCCLDITNAFVFRITPLATDIVLAWYFDTYIQSEYFYKAEYFYLTEDFELNLPDARSTAYQSDELFVPIQLDSLNNTYAFFYKGTAYPAPTLLSGPPYYVEYLDYYPGYRETPSGTLVKVAVEYDLDGGKITESLTRALKDEVRYNHTKVLNWWDAEISPQASTYSAINMYGLDRDDYARVLNELPQSLWRDFVMKTLPQTDQDNYSIIYKLGTIATGIAVSVGDIYSWKWYTFTNILSPSDLNVNIKNLTLQTETLIPSDIEGAIVTADNVTVKFGPERYEPTIDITNWTIAPVQFKEGYNYIHAPLQTLPGSFIPTGLNQGRMPRLNTAGRLWEGYPSGWRGLFSDKMHRFAAEWVFDICKLTNGKAVDEGTETLISGPIDIQSPLRLWNIPTSVIGQITADDDDLGHEDNTVHVRLPLHYKRDEKDWTLAHAIAKAFLPHGLYTIGYHEFAADYSVAGEPIFRYANKPLPIVPTEWQSSNSSIVAFDPWDYLPPSIRGQMFDFVGPIYNDVVLIGFDYNGPQLNINALTGYAPPTYNFGITEFQYNGIIYEVSTNFSLTPPSITSIGAGVFLLSEYGTPLFIDLNNVTSGMVFQPPTINVVSGGSPTGYIPPTYYVPGGGSPTGYIPPLTILPGSPPTLQTVEYPEPTYRDPNAVTLYVPPTFYNVLNP